MKKLSIRSYAYIGDAVYEVFARKKTLFITENPKRLHKATSSIVNAEFQTELLEFIQDFLVEEEKELARRARNLSVTTARRTNHTLHRLSTAFEALIGYLYLNNQDRLKDLYNYIEPLIDKKLLNSSLPSGQGTNLS
ncbi:MAG TPA: ribonuclease III domain-containing protein [Candidatus Gastranaerophilales bacterium]|nr:ribonuclease III domain-containing protein [Candidatus Gastranaerophilales bacterium]